MNFKLMNLLLLAALLSACASIHPGKMAKPIGPQNLPVNISGKTVEYRNGDAFQLIELTVENKSEDWVRIVKSEVIIDNPAESKISVVQGNDLKSWADAIYARQKMEQHNDEMVGLGVAAVGIVAMVAGGSSRNSGLTYAGAGTALTGAAISEGNKISRSIKDAESSGKAPESHLYQPFSVPAKMFQRRWVVMSKPSKKMISSLIIQIEDIRGKKDTYEIKL